MAGLSAAAPMTLHQLVRDGVTVGSWRRRLGRREVAQRDHHGQTLLHVACGHHEPDVDLIRMLLFPQDSSAKADPNARDNDGWTPLHCLCNVGPRMDIIQLLLTAGADVKMTNMDGTSVLHYLVRHSPASAAARQEATECLNSLLEAGAYINAQNKHGETPLHNAIARSNRDNALLLVNKKANCYAANKHGETALHYAVLTKSSELVNLLLDLGIDPRLGNGINGTAIDVARASGQTDILDIMERKASLLRLSMASLSSEGASSPRAPRKKEDVKKKHWEIDYNELNLGNRVGKGAFGSVYAAEWRGTLVALKKIHANQMSAGDIDTFLKEIHIVSKMRHPNIVLFLGACMHQPNVCFITEFARKGDLCQVLRNEPNLPWRLKLRMATDAARGILYLHMCSPPVVHRDLKSLNLLVDDTYNIKVSDFGISKALQNSLNSFSSKMGTLNWLAPEILDSMPYSPAADVYSLGIILWEILTQTVPFKGMSNFAILRAISGGEALSIPDDCDSDYAALMKDMWRADPKERPGMKDVLERLEQIEHRSFDSPSVFLNLGISTQSILLTRVTSAEALAEVPSAAMSPKPVGRNSSSSDPPPPAVSTSSPEVARTASPSRPQSDRPGSPALDGSGEGVPSHRRSNSGHLGQTAQQAAPEPTARSGSSSRLRKPSPLSPPSPSPAHAAGLAKPPKARSDRTGGVPHDLLTLFQSPSAFADTIAEALAEPKRAGRRRGSLPSMADQ